MKKPEFVYPQSDFDRSRNLIAALGSFWSKIYTGSDQVLSYTTATAQLANQTYHNLLETIAGLSRFDIPVFHTEVLKPVVLKTSERNSLAVTQVEFDRNVTVFNSGLKFDVAPETRFVSFPLPENLVDVVQLFNRITFPTSVLQKNIDYLIDTRRGSIIFLQDPFENPAFTKRPEPDSANQDEMTLWGFCAQLDYAAVFNQFAYAVSLKLRSSQGYKDLTNAVISGLIAGGATAAVLDAALAAICGAPISVGPRETVEVIETDSRGLLIVTDTAVYRFPQDAIPRVHVDQIIPAGTPLVYGVDVQEFFVGNSYVRDSDQQGVCCPPPNHLLASAAQETITTEFNEDILLDPNADQCRPTRKKLAALALDSGFLAACFYGDLVFENKAAPLTIDVAHPTGYTYVKFPLGGYPADVQQFFDEIHSRGIEAAEYRKSLPACDVKPRIGTLAHLLDRRVNAATEPTAAHLPKTINPLQFLVENVLRNNVFVVRISVAALGANQLGLYNIRHLRQLLPPQTAMIVVFELTAGVDKIAGPQAVSEAVTKFIGMEPQVDNVPESLVHDLGATARLVSGTCQ